MKRENIIISLLITFIVLFVILWIKREKDYEMTYKVNNYEIYESYNKKLKYYFFSLKYNNRLYELGISHNYLEKKKLIDKVDIENDDIYSCVYLNSDVLNTYPVCYEDDKSISYYLSNKLFNFNYIDLITVNNKFDNLTINSYVTKNIFTWNYYGYDLLSMDSNKNIKLFNSDTYQDKYSFRVDNYIIIPNYDEKYAFNSFYIIDMRAGNFSKLKMENEISYNFYLLGVHNKKGYIVDSKAKVEYEIDPKNKKIRIVSNDKIGKIWNGKWEEESIVRLSSKKYSFLKEEKFIYSLEDKKLFMSLYSGKNKTKLVDTDVDRIIYYDNHVIYYLSQNKLYSYSPYYGEILMMKNKEWEFNDYLSIFIY